MRNAIKKNKTSLALSAVAAAGLSAWAGAPAAQGALVVTPIDIGNFTIGGTTFTTYVFTAAGSGSTGTLLEAGQINIDTPQSSPGAIATDTEDVNGKTGGAARYAVDLDGAAQPTDTGVPSNQGSTASADECQAVFGDPGAGTFGGVGFNDDDGESVAAAFSASDITDNPFVTEGPGSTAFVYTNGQTTTYLASGNVASTWGGNGASVKTSSIDPNLLKSATVGQVVAPPTLYSLQTDFSAYDGTTTHYQPANAANPDPFYQVVVTQGSAFTLTGTLAFNLGASEFVTVIGGGGSPTAAPIITLTNTAPTTTLGASFNMSPGTQSGGYSLKTSAIASGAITAGYTDTTGFNPATSVEVYGLLIKSNGTTATGSTLSTIVASLEASLQSQDANWNAYTLPSGPSSGPGASAVGILEAAGDNAELVFPDVTDDAYLSWSLSSLTGPVTITQVSVVPEPTGIAALALGGIGLLSRKRRRKA